MAKTALVPLTSGAGLSVAKRGRRVELGRGAAGGVRGVGRGLASPHGWCGRAGVGVLGRGEREAAQKGEKALLLFFL